MICIIRGLLSLVGRINLLSFYSILPHLWFIRSFVERKTMSLDLVWVYRRNATNGLVLRFIVGRR
jgi:hypothetical protein